MLRVLALVAVAAVAQTEGAAKGGKLFKRHTGAGLQSNVVRTFSNAPSPIQGQQFYQQPQQSYQPQQQQYYQPQQQQYYQPQQKQYYQPQQQQFYQAQQSASQQQGFWQFVPSNQLSAQQPAQQQPIAAAAAPQNPFAQMTSLNNKEIAAQEAAAQEPVVEEEVVEKLVMTKPVLQRRRPAARNPAAKKQAAKKPAAKSPVPKRTVTTHRRQFGAVPMKFDPTNLDSVIRNSPANSQLIRAGVVSGAGLLPILDRLPDNATLIRSNIVDTFSCAGRSFDYYADVENDCQVFHICAPQKEIFKDDPAVASVPDVTYHYSFICNSFTIFSQDTRTCAWSKEALPCSEAERYLSITDSEWFKTTTTTPAPLG